MHEGEVGAYDGSPYDFFLEKNLLPRRPENGQSALYYSRHLATLIEDLRSPKFVTPREGRFRIVKQEFRFGPEELAGCKIFFTLATPRAEAARRQGGIGNCLACHEAPHFTDFGFHNTSASQEEYDEVHGSGAFARLPLPGLEERNRHVDAYLPPTARHPEARGPFMAIPALGQPGRADLGLWNVFANPDLPASQPPLRQLLGLSGPLESEAAILPKTIALFKTPSLRGLALSDPYLHTGRKDSLEAVIRFYISFSQLARSGLVRNPAPEMQKIHLSPEDIPPLVAFLKSLNEDYD